MIKVKRLINKNFDSYACNLFFVDENLQQWRGAGCQNNEVVVLWTSKAKASRLAHDILKAIGEES